MFAYKGSFEFDLITLIDSLTVSPFFAAKKIYEELDINNSACWILKPDLYFSIGKITILTAALMHSFRVWYVQCLATGEQTNSEFDRIHSFESWTVIWFSCSEKIYEELDIQQLHRPGVCKIQRLSFQNCLAVRPIFGWETSFPLN